MRLGLVGGTGKEGSGLAVRWAMAGHKVTIGSRDRARGEARAKDLSEKAGAIIDGGDNTSAIVNADIVVLCVPYSAHSALCEELKTLLQGKIVIDITVPLQPPKVRRVHLPEGQSAALEAQEILGDDVRLVATLHHVSSIHLNDLTHNFEADVLVCGNNIEAREEVMDLIIDLGMNPVDAGPLVNSIALEAMTPVLLHINRKYKSKSAGLFVTGIQFKEEDEEG